MRSRIARTAAGWGLVIALGSPGTGCTDTLVPPGPPETGTIQAILAVDLTSEGFLAVGTEFEFIGNSRTIDSDLPLILRSADGADWSRVAAPGVGALDDFTVGNGRIVAVGALQRARAPLVLFSDGPQGWSESGTPPAQPIRSIAFGDGKFMGLSIDVASFTPIILTSPDGEIWTETARLSHAGTHVDFWGGEFVVWGESDQIAFSPDGVEWETVRLAEITQVVNLEFVGGQLVGNGVHDCCFGEVPDAIRYVDFVSTDGRSFDIVTRATPREVFFARTLGNNAHLAVSGGSVWRSTTAFGPWEERLTTNAGLFDIVFGRGVFVAVGHGVLSTSTDGIRWEVNHQPF